MFLDRADHRMEHWITTLILLYSILTTLPGINMITAVELATYLFELLRLQGGPMHCSRKGWAGKVKEMEITK